MTLLFGKPRKRKSPVVRTMPDGREICSKSVAGMREYRIRIQQMCIRDNSICCLCGETLDPLRATFEHKRSRGAGGAFRDDRIEFNGVSHYFGNLAKGSISYERYMTLPAEDRIRNCQGGFK